MWLWGGAGALARGYNCLTFDGPGQGYAFWKQNLHFRPDWEKVITPVVDFTLTRPEVDPKRIALQGISQGGYWVPRALAFEKRIAAGIADPGVVDVSTSWTASFPTPMLELLKAGRKAEFDAFMAKSLTPAVKSNLNFRMRPYGFTSYYDTFKATLDYNLTAVAAQIRCPMLITEPANEVYWPGQSKQLFDLLTCPKQLVHFSEADGADLHCEPQSPGLRDLRVFNWLDETLKL
jgi:pimeloyl-ACP methyl ester carboxylesterase